MADTKAMDFWLDYNIIFVKQQLAFTKICYDWLKETPAAQAIGKWLESLASKEYPRGVTSQHGDATWFLSPEEHGARWLFMIPPSLLVLCMVYWALCSKSMAPQRVCSKSHPKSGIVAGFFFCLSVYLKIFTTGNPKTVLHCFMPCYWMSVIWVLYGIWPCQLLFNILICFRGVASIGFFQADYYLVSPLQYGTVVTMHVFQLSFPTYLLCTTEHTMNRSVFYGTMVALLPGLIKLYFIVPLDIYFDINGAYTLYLLGCPTPYFYTPMMCYCILCNVSSHFLGTMEQRIGRYLFSFYPKKNDELDKKRAVKKLA